ncbi:TolC family protein [Yeosuana sp. MJ-SS3]|uniref:TolC family protein n=1 Tax=Gilvirhabdus luticola TaxID=3079858 RepID=A0ABU3U890_9FLAO|nr:TolC family protein [Yeosuana sp. MJ-SS3]MDU8886622.1 TolC family protein [Yeosuana sp. MJ-SS3]
MKKNFIIFFVLLGIISQAQVKKWTLPECVEYALENNITVKQSELDLEETELNKKDAFGNFLPSLNLNSSHRWNIGLTGDPVSGTNVNATTQTSQIGIGTNVDIFRGRQNINQMHRANLEILSRQYQLDDMKDDISLFVANAFLQILFNKEQLKVLRGQQQISSQEFKRTTDLVEAGALPKGDLLEIQATIASQEQQIVNSENALQISKINLAQIMLIEDYENFDIEDVEYTIPPSSILNESPNTIFEKAKETRYDIKIAKTSVEIAEQNLKINKGALYPSLTGFYNFGTSYFYNKLNPTLPSFKDQISDNKGHSLGLQLNVPIFNGLSTSNNVKRNQVNVERTKNRLEQASLDLQTSIYQAYNDTKGASKAYEAAIKTLEAREEAFKYSQERYNVGLLNAFNYSQSQNRFEAAQSEVIRTKYDYIFKLKVLEFYFGIPITDIN